MSQSYLTPFGYCLSNIKNGTNFFKTLISRPTSYSGRILISMGLLTLAWLKCNRGMLGLGQQQPAMGWVQEGMAQQRSGTREPGWALAHLHCIAACTLTVWDRQGYFHMAVDLTSAGRFLYVNTALGAWGRRSRSRNVDLFANPCAVLLSG